MNEIKKNPGIRGRIPIAILILSYVALGLISMIISFVDNLDFKEYGYLFLQILPTALLGVYFLALHKIHSATPYLVLAIGVNWSSGIFGLWDSIFYLLSGGSELYLFGGSEMVVSEVASLFSSAATILFAVTIFLMLCGSKISKIMMIIASSFSCLGCIGSMFSFVDIMMRYEGIVKLAVFGMLRPLLFYVALILYAAFNNPASCVSATPAPAVSDTAEPCVSTTPTPSVSSAPQPAKQSALNMSNNGELAIYQTLLLKGIITPEEYEAKRKEIISKL